jgi:hypothetical protein
MRGERWSAGRGTTELKSVLRSLALGRDPGRVGAGGEPRALERTRELARERPDQLALVRRHAALLGAEPDAEHAEAPRRR